MSDGDTCRVKVVCRVRPLNEKEKANGSTVVVSFPGENTVGLGVGGGVNIINKYCKLFRASHTRCV